MPVRVIVKIHWIDGEATVHTLTAAQPETQLYGSADDRRTFREIALSIALVAGEALHRERTLARRWPAVVAFLFGLVHGLGFAGALKDIGLPQNHLPAALLTFNLGVELGQLLVVAAAFVAYRALARRPELKWARVPALYAIGGVAVYWSIDRIVALVA